MSTKLLSGITLGFGLFVSVTTFGASPVSADLQKFVGTWKMDESSCKGKELIDGKMVEMTQGNTSSDLEIVRIDHQGNIAASYTCIDCTGNKPGDPRQFSTASQRFEKESWGSHTKVMVTTEANFNGLPHGELVVSSIRNYGFGVANNLYRIQLTSADDLTYYWRSDAYNVNDDEHWGKKGGTSEYWEIICNYHRVKK